MDESEGELEKPRLLIYSGKKQDSDFPAYQVERAKGVDELFDAVYIDTTKPHTSKRDTEGIQYVKPGGTIYYKNNEYRDKPTGLVIGGNETHYNEILYDEQTTIRPNQYQKIILRGSLDPFDVFKYMDLGTPDAIFDIPKSLRECFLECNTNIHHVNRCIVPSKQKKLIKVKGKDDYVWNYHRRTEGVSDDSLPKIQRAENGYQIVKYGQGYYASVSRKSPGECLNVYDVMRAGFQSQLKSETSRGAEKTAEKYDFITWNGGNVDHGKLTALQKKLYNKHSAVLIPENQRHNIFSPSGEREINKDEEKFVVLSHEDLGNRRFPDIDGGGWIKKWPGELPKDQFVLMDERKELITRKGDAKKNMDIFVVIGGEWYQFLLKNVLWTRTWENIKKQLKPTENCDCGVSVCHKDTCRDVCRYHLRDFLQNRFGRTMKFESDEKGGIQRYRYKSVDDVITKFDETFEPGEKVTATIENQTYHF